ncbi:MAG TPA: acyl carrier protein [Xanthobacteraceae bacterium]|nr:acyl carrier protein [Xanthobacteraceae bacterium]
MRNQWNFSEVNMQISVRTTVLSEMGEVAAQNGKALPPLTDDNIALAHTGLDSLCLAVLVARLEDRLGVDPFGSAEGGDFPVTLADFVRLYEKAFSESEATRVSIRNADPAPTRQSR